jgi:hypothetical protein
MIPCESVIEAAERHVRSGRRIVASQEALVTRLRASGGDCVTAEILLAAFRKSLAIFEDDLSCLSRR